jgi:hypothetical protein
MWKKIDLNKPSISERGLFPAGTLQTREKFALTFTLNPHVFQFERLHTLFT